MALIADVQPGLEYCTTGAAYSRMRSMLSKLSLASPAARRRFEKPLASGGEQSASGRPHGPLTLCTMSRPVACSFLAKSL